MMSNMGSHFIVIGAQKAATTWLQHVLYCDSKFWYPEGQGEVQFFNRDYDKGLDYYLSLYREAPDRLISADVTPDYLDCEDTPRRIYEAKSKIDRPLRFMLICREPVSRLLSAYQMKVRYGFSGSLSDAIAADPSLIDKGCYWTHLQRWLQFFPRKHLLIALFDNVKRDKQYFFGQIEDFLDLENSIMNPYGDGRVNPGGFRRYPIIERAFQAGGQLVRLLGAEWLVYWLKKYQIVQAIYDWNREKTSLEERIDVPKERLRDIFKGEVEQLARWMDEPALIEAWGYD